MILADDLPNPCSTEIVSISRVPSSREIITFNPEEATLLKDAYTHLTEALTPEMGEEELLSTLISFVRNEVFVIPLCKEPIVKAIVDHLTTTKYRDRKIPLEEFASYKVGLCRHFVLVTDYLLERLIQDGRCNGTTYIKRKDNHTWNILITENHKMWHIDAFWNLLNDKKENT